MRAEHILWLGVLGLSHSWYLLDPEVRGPGAEPNRNRNPPTLPVALGMALIDSAAPTRGSGPEQAGTIREAGLPGQAQCSGCERDFPVALSPSAQARPLRPGSPRFLPTAQEAAL